MDPLEDSQWKEEKRIKDGKLEGERKKCRVRVSKVRRNIRVTFDDKTRTVLSESSLGSQSKAQGLAVSTGWSRTLGSPPKCHVLPYLPVTVLTVGFSLFSHFSVLCSHTSLDFKGSVKRPSIHHEDYS